MPTETNCVAANEGGARQRGLTTVTVTRLMAAAPTGSPIERRDRDGGQPALASPTFVGANADVSVGISKHAHAVLSTRMVLHGAGGGVAGREANPHCRNGSPQPVGWK